MKLECKFCPPTVVPDDLPASVRTHAAEHVRAGSRARAHLLLHEEGGLRLDVAKGIALHLALVAGRCQRCGSEVAGQEYDRCSQCGALTINW